MMARRIEEGAGLMSLLMRRGRTSFSLGWVLPILLVAVFSGSASATSEMRVQQRDSASAVRVFANCAALNRVYPHGVGRKGARDHVSGTSRPVTNFTVNTTLYNANRNRDRDRDGVACEKR
jgi:hypothetical protein